ncbi:MAG: D-alanyl-D-alanine carboxypeptidase family protein [Campylobacterota bacterium]|nr:D-alanyl-D-alanine carboxypeptidase family protein [Campylobacterota bacterium]
MNRRNFLLLSALTPVFAKDYISINQDVNLHLNDLKILYTLDNRLKRLRRFIGFANLNIIGLDQALYYARNYSAIGKFTKEEISLIEKLFYSEPSNFGFYGDKTVQNISQTISTKDIEKISRSGHYVFKGKPLDDYNRILKDVGDNLILTSGIRNVIKQLSLYISKVKSLNGNLSKASTVIAPPAYTYHAISDFDIGKKGWGNRNFTAEFAQTKEFQEMTKLEYVSIRYTINNKDGVRFEPWHVKVI